MCSPIGDKNIPHFRGKNLNLLWFNSDSSALAVGVQ